MLQLANLQAFKHSKKLLTLRKSKSVNPRDVAASKEKIKKTTEGEAIDEEQRRKGKKKKPRALGFL